MSPKHLRVINLDQYIFTAPTGEEFIFRYSLEEFIPTHLVAQLNLFLDRHGGYYPLPLSEQEPMYVGYAPEHVMEFFLSHIGNEFTVVRHTSLHDPNHSAKPQDTDVPGQTAERRVEDALREEEVPCVSGDEVPSPQI